MSRNLKRKYTINTASQENGEDALKNIIATSLMENIIGNKKQKVHKEEVYRENNHIYFRTDVTVENCDVLLQLVREFEEDIKLTKSDPYIDDTKIIIQVFEVVKTEIQDIYKLYAFFDENGIIKKQKIGISYINSYDNSIKCKKIFNETITKNMRCRFNPHIKKWIIENDAIFNYPFFI